MFRGNSIGTLSNNINALRRYRSDTKVLEILKAVWDEDTEQYADFSWPLLRHATVRVAVAFALHELDGRNAGDYAAFIRSQLWVGDSETRSNAAANLGIIGSNVDIPLLERLVLEGDMLVAIGAASALGMLCTSESRLALVKLSRASELSHPKKDVIRQVLSSSVWTCAGEKKMTWDR